MVNSSESEQKIMMLQGKLSQFQVKYSEEIEDMVRKSQEAAMKIEELLMRNNKLSEENMRMKERFSKNENQYESLNEDLKEIIGKKSKVINEL